MIILDTHIWIWWVHDETRLTRSQLEEIYKNETQIIGICSISIWEIAKLVEFDRLELSIPIQEWFDLALEYPGVSIIEISPEIAIESTQLPGKFHRDPADQLIVATARTFNCQLITSDNKIINYPYVKTVK